MRRLLLLLIPCALVLAQNPKIPKEARVGYQSINANDLSARLHFIASPDLEGRETTTRGQKIAARYIASEFQRLGLKPIGDSGTYFQRFNAEATKISDQSNLAVTMKQGSSNFMIGKDFIAYSALDAPVTAPVIFVGYMDAKVDSSLTKGKIVMALPGRKEDGRDTSVSPRTRMGLVRLFPGSLARIIIADESGPLSIEGQSARFEAAMKRGSMAVVGAQARPGRATGGFPPLVSPGMATAILKETGKTLAQLRLSAYQDSSFQPIALTQATVTIDIKNSKELKTTENVVGFMEGSDPKLKDEVVAFTGHYDHLGVTPDGVVYPGADDDGSGTVTVLELAEAFTSNPVKPKRSMLFMTVVGEEKGLWGSEWYVNHPILPLEKTVADLNTDMIGRTDKKYDDLKSSNYVYVIGSDKISTQLDSVLKASNKETENLILDYTFNDDKDPNQFYRRSDHYNFAKNGVPIVFFFTGVHADYHRPTDTVDKILFDRMVRIVRVIYATGWKVANMKGGLVKNVGSSLFAK
ncbi:MAG: M28 family peptidase [Ignavibacteriales bacterium]|nr:M28 family peptidase [Ignavibacteriales bacterium]